MRAPSSNCKPLSPSEGPRLGLPCRRRKKVPDAGTQRSLRSPCELATGGTAGGQRVVQVVEILPLISSPTDLVLSLCEPYQPGYCPHFPPNGSPPASLGNGSRLFETCTRMPVAMGLPAFSCGSTPACLVTCSSHRPDLRLSEHPKSAPYREIRGSNERSSCYSLSPRWPPLCDAHAVA